LRYEGWAPNQWEVVGIVSEISIDSRNYDSIVTPDGQAHKMYGLFKPTNLAAWAEETSILLQEYKDYLAVKCFINQ